jgi:flagellar basal body-associated protein FliL
MKESAIELGTIIKWCLFGLVAIIILTVGLTAINGTLYPWWLSIQRKSVEQSKSFTDANNNMLESYKLEYIRLDTKIAEAQGVESIAQAYEAQQKAIVEKMCRQISTMAQGTVNPNTITWLNGTGGCR